MKRNRIRVAVTSMATAAMLALGTSVGAAPASASVWWGNEPWCTHSVATSYGISGSLTVMYRYAAKNRAGQHMHYVWYSYAPFYNRGARNQGHTWRYC